MCEPPQWLELAPQCTFLSRYSAQTLSAGWLFLWRTVPEVCHKTLILFHLIPTQYCRMNQVSHVLGKYSTTEVPMTFCCCCWVSFLFLRYFLANLLSRPNLLWLYKPSALTSQGKFFYIPERWFLYWRFITVLNISYLHLGRRSLRWKGTMWLPQGPTAKDTDTVSLACRPVKSPCLSVR